MGDFPPVNIWILTLCASKLCGQWTDPDAVLVFPIPGFELRQRHPLSMQGLSEALAARGALALVLLAFLPWPYLRRARVNLAPPFFLAMQLLFFFLFSRDA